MLKVWPPAAADPEKVPSLPKSSPKSLTLLPSLQSAPSGTLRLCKSQPAPASRPLRSLILPISLPIAINPSIFIIGHLSSPGLCYPIGRSFPQICSRFLIILRLTAPACVRLVPREPPRITSTPINAVNISSTSHNWTT